MLQGRVLGLRELAESGLDIGSGHWYKRGFKTHFTSFSHNPLSLFLPYSLSVLSFLSVLFLHTLLRRDGRRPAVRNSGAAITNTHKLFFYYFLLFPSTLSPNSFLTLKVSKNKLKTPKSANKANNKKYLSSLLFRFSSFWLGGGCGFVVFEYDGADAAVVVDLRLRLTVCCALV